MTAALSDEDRALDALWREKYGVPLPILGAGDIVRAILALPPTTPPAEAA